MSEGSTSNRRSFYKRAIGWIILLAIILIPAAHFIWGVWADHRLNTTLAALHAAGEPINSDELKLNSVPDGQNASLDYLAAGDSIDTTTAAWKNFDDATSGSFQLPLNSAERATVQSIVQENTTALARTAAARGKTPGGWNDPFTNPNILTPIHLNGARSLANLLKFAAFNAHTHGDDQTALQWVSDALTEADAGEHRPTLIGHLVAIGCTALACDTASHLAAELQIGNDHLSRQDILQLLGQFQDESAMNDGARLCWRSERIVTLNTMRDLADGSLSSAAVAGPSGPSSPTAARLQGYAIKPLVLSDAGLYAKYLQGVMLAQTAPDWPAAELQMPKDLRMQTDAHPFEHLFLRLLLPSLERAAQTDYRAKSQRRLAVVALAVRLYAADHNNQLPPALADLVPAYLPAIPNDAMDGKPLRYKSNPPRIYGLGLDGVDYGGIPQDHDSSDKTRRQHGDLVVYLRTQPRAATATTELSPPGMIAPGGR